MRFYEMIMPHRLESLFQRLRGSCCLHLVCYWITFHNPCTAFPYNQLIASSQSLHHHLNLIQSLRRCTKRLPLKCQNKPVILRGTQSPSRFSFADDIFTCTPQWHKWDQTKVFGTGLKNLILIAMGEKFISPKSYCTLLYASQSLHAGQADTAETWTTLLHGFRWSIHILPRRHTPTHTYYYLVCEQYKH